MNKLNTLKPAAIPITSLAFVCALCLALLTSMPANAQRELLKDINTLPTHDGYDPFNFLKATTSQVFFNRHGGLWTTNGTTTTLVKSFNRLFVPTIVGSKAYFAADAGDGF